MHILEAALFSNATRRNRVHGTNELQTRPRRAGLAATRAAAAMLILAGVVTMLEMAPARPSGMLADTDADETISG